MIPIEADVNKVLFCMKRDVTNLGKGSKQIELYRDKLSARAQSLQNMQIENGMKV